MSSTKWNKLLKGIRFRLTLVYATLFGLFICAFAYLMTNEYFRTGREDFDFSLINYAIDLSEHLVTDKSGVHIAINVPGSEVKKAFPFALNKTYYSLRTIDGKVLAKSHKVFPFKEIPYDATLPLKQDYTHRLLSFENSPDVYRAVNLKITGKDFGREMIVQVATLSNTIRDRERDQLLLTSLMLPILILISSIASYLIAGNALGPIKSLTDTANNIAAQNLSLRVPEVNTGDEVEELSKTLNTLLTRLEKSFKGQENFVANASHQLNTPLAIIKGELDVLQSKERSLPDYQKFHKSLREEIERLIELVKNLLLVSRVESGQENFVFHTLRLDELLLGIITRLQNKARDKKILIRFDIDETMDVEVLGEKQLLDSLFENLIENAIKYSPESSIIGLSMKNIEGKIEVWIRDEGPGITPEEMETILTKRFRRGSSYHLPGAGIGLSIAHQIAEYHKAKISYEKLSDGSLFVVRFN